MIKKEKIGFQLKVGLTNAGIRISLANKVEIINNVVL